MKGMTAIEVLVMKLLKNNNIKLKGDVVLAATADEEKGSVSGVTYLLQNHHQKIFCPYVLNEGGGLAIPTKNGYVLTVQTAEKGILWLRIKAKGLPGHGSTPNIADNAITRMNKIIEKLDNYRPEILFVPTLKQFLEGMAKKNPDLNKLFSRMIETPKQTDQILNELAKRERALAEDIRPRTRTTIAPTMIQGGVKENIIPSECEAVFDCRVLPGQRVNETIDLIKSLLKDVGLEKLTFEILQAHDGTESQLETPLYKAITSVISELKPELGIIPTLTTGATDSRFLRDYGSTCYGFHPMIPDEPNDQLEKRVHGIDERITMENLAFGTGLLYEVVKKFSS
jgi:acetylornithine deacetylase/succinyl-diaminopimelate desuccinylase-like protein